MPRIDRADPIDRGGGSMTARSLPHARCAAPARLHARRGRLAAVARAAARGRADRAPLRRPGRRARARSDYFRLLARDPEILGARTLDRQGHLLQPPRGLPRAERELAAAAASRVNGCIFCASVHARFAAHYSKRRDDVAAPARRGRRAPTSASAGTPSSMPSVALTATPIAFGPEHVARLRAAGLDDLEIADVIHGAAFFNWANRLMLSIGRPVAPVGGLREQRDLAVGAGLDDAVGGGGIGEREGRAELDREPPGGQQRRGSPGAPRRARRAAAAVSGTGEPPGTRGCRRTRHPAPARASRCARGRRRGRARSDAPRRCRRHRSRR